MASHQDKSPTSGINARTTAHVGTSGSGGGGGSRKGTWSDDLLHLLLNLRPNAPKAATAEAKAMRRQARAGGAWTLNLRWLPKHGPAEVTQWLQYTETPPAPMPVPMAVPDSSSKSDLGMRSAAVHQPKTQAETGAAGLAAPTVVSFVVQLELRRPCFALTLALWQCYGSGSLAGVAVLLWLLLSTPSVHIRTHSSIESDVHVLCRQPGMYCIVLYCIVLYCDWWPGSA